LRGAHKFKGHAWSRKLSADDNDRSGSPKGDFLKLVARRERFELPTLGSEDGFGTVDFIESFFRRLAKPPLMHQCVTTGLQNAFQASRSRIQRAARRDGNSSCRGSTARRIEWPVMVAISPSVQPESDSRKTAVPRKSWKVTPVTPARSHAKILK